MKVLHITTAFSRSENDFITPWLTETLKRLKKFNIECEVFTSSYKGLSSQIISGIKVHRFRYFFSRFEDLTHEENVPDRLRKSFRYKFLLICYLFLGVLGIINLLKRNSYDVIHIHWPFPHFILGYIGKFFAKRRSILISSFYGVELRWIKGRLKIFLRLLKWIIKKSDVVTAISKYTAKEIKEVLAKEIKIIPFGAAVNPSSGSFEPLKKAKEEKVILFVGRLVERKGVKYLILAFREVLKEIKAKLFIIGEGRERNDLEKLAKDLDIYDKIEFKGFVTDSELLKYYQLCDVFVLPAIVDERGDTEGLGVVLLEALLHKKPVIASNVGGILDIVKDGETGILVPEKDVNLLAKKIIEVLKDEELARNLGERGYIFAQNNFSWDKIIRALKETYENCLK